MLDQSLYTSPLSECEKSPMGCVWTLGPQLVELFGKAVDLHEVEPCWRSKSLGDELWETTACSTSCLLSAFWPQMHPMGHHVFPALRDYPTWTPRQTKASLLLNSVFSSHSNKKSEHCNHLRVHVLAHECWKTIKHSNHSTAVPIQKTEKQKWFRRPAQYCQPSW